MSLTHATNVVNLMPHPATLYTATGVRVIPPSGQMARVRSTVSVTSTVLGVEVLSDRVSPVVGLPDPEPDTVYLVSGRVLYALAVLGVRRSDVLSPATSSRDGAVRDANGRVVGVTRFRGLAGVADSDGIPDAEI